MGIFLCDCSDLAKCLHKLFRINDGWIQKYKSQRDIFLACFLWHKNECDTGHRVYWPNSGIGYQLWVEWTQKPKFTSSPSFEGKYLFYESLGDRPSVWNPDQMTHYEGVRQVRARARRASSLGLWSGPQAMVGLTGPWAAIGRVRGGNRTQEC